MKEVRYPLSRLPHDQTSVTIPDSFSAMEIGPQFGLPLRSRPYHGKVYRLNQPQDLVAQYGDFVSQADDEYAGHEKRDGENFIEIQLWSDKPLLSLTPEAFVR